jgi:hypothetical protein
MVMAVVACSEGNGAERMRPAEHAGARAVLLSQSGGGERDVLRIRTDLERGRLWVLGVDNVYVFELATRRLVRKIALPDWSVSGFGCDPDLALDSTGTAWVSSNSLAKLWRIAGGDFSVTEHPVRLRGREQWDVGFGALAFGPHGALFAMTANAGGTLWEIDPHGGAANLVEIGTPSPNRCEFTDLFAGIAAAQVAARSQLPKE